VLAAFRCSVSDYRPCMYFRIARPRRYCKEVIYGASTHIRAGLIKDLMELVTSGMSAAAQEVIRETIAHTQTARGEPTLCNWLDDGHNKIHPCLQWFTHDAMYHLWRVLPPRTSWWW
jgi:hypothetical protein